MLIVNTAVRRQAEEDVLAPLCFLSAGDMRLNLNPPSLRPGRISLSSLFTFHIYLMELRPCGALCVHVHLEFVCGEETHLPSL